MAKILVVDDDADSRAYFTKLLGYYHHQLLEARDGQEGLEVTRAERPDVVICDLQMPQMDGFEYARQLRADPALRDTLVIFSTAVYQQREIVSRASGCGVLLFLTKPAPPGEVLQAVRAALKVFDRVDTGQA